MILSKIEMRFKIFPEYLKYKMDFIVKNDFFSQYQVIKRFEMFGVIYHRTNEDRLLTFNEWLYYNKYENIII